MWAAKAFVSQVAGPRGDKGDTGQPGSMAELSVRDYKEITDVLRRELNGRYMMAEEARDRFSAIDKRLEHLMVKVGVEGG